MVVTGSWVKSVGKIPWFHVWKWSVKKWYLHFDNSWSIASIWCYFYYNGICRGYCIAPTDIMVCYTSLHCNTVQYTVLHCTLLRCTVLFIVLYCILLYCIVLYCIVLYCIVLYCIVLYCIVLYCIVLYCIVWSEISLTSVCSFTELFHLRACATTAKKISQNTTSERGRDDHFSSSLHSKRNIVGMNCSCNDFVYHIFKSLMNACYFIDWF